MRKTIFRSLAFLLALTLLVSAFPLSAFAEEATEPPEGQTDFVADGQPGEEIVLPVEELVDQEPTEEISEALEDTPHSEEAELAELSPEASLESAEEDGSDEAQLTAEPSPEPTDGPADAEGNYDGSDVVKVNTSTASAGGPRKAKGTGEKGKLRNLYYTMDESIITQTTTMGQLCGVPAHAIILGDGKTVKAAYCLNHDRGATNMNSYTWIDAVQSGQSDVIGTICALGFQYTGQPGGDMPTPWGRGDSNDKWLVTQLLVWAACNNYITIGADHLIHIDSAVDADMAKVAPNTYNPSGFSSYYASVKAKLLAFRQIPSFASYAAENGKAATDPKPITLKWDGSQYTASATDKNGVLSHFHLEETISGVKITQSGNNITLSTTTEISGTKTSSVVQYAPQGGSNALAYWTTTSGDTSQQDFAVLYNDGYDPINAILTVTTKGPTTKNAGLKKISEDGIVSGIMFTITGSDGKSYTKTTDSSGQIDIQGLPIFIEKPMTDSSGKQLHDEITGEALTENGDPITYTVTEQTPIRYVKPQPQSFRLDGAEVSLEFENRLKKWNVSVTKSDRETGSRAQGDASLGGAVYGIYHNGVLQDQYTTNASGNFTSKWYPCGTGWTLKEIRPSEGYLLNVETVSVGVTPESTTIEYNSTSKGVNEQVIKGRVSIVKHTDDGSTQIETPEVGAEFQIYLNASGSYAKALVTERDTLTINEAGFAQSKLLPYGRYTVHQTKGWEGKEKITDFEVFIAEDDHTYPFIINNREFESYVEVVKRDATTGRVIPASGIGFKIKDLTSGKWVSQHINYPTPQDIVVFYTDVTGKLMLPEPLGYGTYELWEQNSAYGYTLATQPAQFKIDGTYKTVTVTMTNTPQMGQVTIRKSGEVFASVNRSGSVYQPVYEVTGLKGAVYAMYAEEDIVTLDGTKRYSLGELVEQVETNADGVAVFPAVYLGKYKVVEVTAPTGYVKDNTEYHVNLEYAGQTVPLITEKLECYDVRQQVKIDLTKTLEQDSVFGLGDNGEYQQVRFGLYAYEKLTAKDGTTIPANGLIETVGISASGKATFSTDLPFGKYYVREIATDEHYILNSEKYPVTFSYAGQKVAVVSLHANDNQPIENELTRGRVEGKKMDDDKKPLGGALFGLFPDGTNDFDERYAILTTKSNGDGVFSFEDVPYGKYLVKEITAPFGYVLNGEIFPINIRRDGDVVEISLEDKAQKGTIRLYKEGEVFASVTEDNGIYTPVYELRGLRGAVYEIIAAEDIRTYNDTLKHRKGEVVDTVTTNSTGHAQSKELYLGNYTVREIKAPYGKVVNSVPQSAALRYAGQLVEITETSVGFTNDRQRVSIDLKKSVELDDLFGIGRNGEVDKIAFSLFAAEDIVAQDGTKIPKDGLVEVIYLTGLKERNGYVHGTAAFAADLPLGTYYVNETSFDQHYLPADAYTVGFSYEDQTVKMVAISLNGGKEIENKIIRGRVEGKKLDDDGKALAGALFGLFPGATTDFAEKNTLLTSSSNAEGLFRFENVAYGSYLVKEINAPYGYVLPTDIFPVTIREDGQVLEIKSVNDAQLGIIKLYKEGEVFASVAEKDGVYKPVYEVRGLPGAVYEITAAEDISTANGTAKYAKGEIVDTVTTDETGHAESKPLYLGSYTVKEIKAPYGMVLHEEPQTATLEYAGQEVEITETNASFTDVRQKLAVDLSKSVEIDDFYKLGRNGEAEKVAFSLFAAEDITAADGTVIPAGGLLETVHLTDLEEADGAFTGHAAFTADLPLGSYVVRETGFDEHYLPAEDFPVIFQYENQTVKTVEIHLNDGEPIANDLIRGNLYGHKIDEDGLDLAGAKFGLFFPDTTEFTEENAIVTSTSAEDGSFSFTDIPYGKWLVKEIAVPVQFVLSDAIFEVEITEDGQEIAYELENQYIKGNVQLTKVDAQYPQNKLRGGLFAVYKDVDGDRKLTPLDEKVGYLTEVANGVYRMEQLRYGEYFVVEERAPRFFVRDYLPHYFEIRNNGETVTVSTWRDCYLNLPQRGSLAISKSSEDGIIEGRQFRVTGTAFTGQIYDQVITTDANGSIFIHGLRVGTYTVSEVGDENNVQYVLPDAQTVTIHYGAVQSVEFYNKLKRGSIFGVKQGESENNLAGVVFGLFPEGTEEFSEENAISTSTTGKTGQFVFRDIPYGKYLIKELSTIPGFVLLADPIPAEITEDGQEVDLGIIVNQHIKVQISKQDITTGKELPGAKLEILGKDGKVIESWISTDKPHLIERLPAGDYTLREITAPDGYELAEEVKFTVEETGEIQTVIMKDKPKPAPTPTPHIPNTGENRPIAVAGLVLVLSLSGAAVLFLFGRRRRKK